jgi:hypothetical protein
MPVTGVFTGSFRSFYGRAVVNSDSLSRRQVHEHCDLSPDTALPARYQVFFPKGDFTNGASRWKAIFLAGRGASVVIAKVRTHRLLLRGSSNRCAEARLAYSVITMSGRPRRFSASRPTKAVDHAPMVVHDTYGLARVAGAGPGTVVLYASGDVVKPHTEQTRHQPVFFQPRPAIQRFIPPGSTLFRIVSSWAYPALRRNVRARP